MKIAGYELLFQGSNFTRLLGGVWEVVKISAISLVLGLAIGIVFGMIRTSRNPFIRIIFKLYLEIFRIVPLLVLLFLFYYLLPEMFNWQISNQTVSILVFVLWISAEMSDLTRSALENVSQNQIEIGKSLGFNRIQLYQEILLPQGLKTIIPTTINLVTRVIKTTSLLMMIGVTEMIRVGQQIIENYTIEVPTASLWIYGIIFCIYFILCYPLSKFASYLERSS
ncbi:amino acid ABC transporter permease [Enterococcus alishanensis]|uniref:Amino acid ABC transporter permease n=1 Tax=Enterococcus alishanensis TaxID=1303817 RepID=A0ABS6TDP4_9ENTE|nr:amino acid ABC transporter permease [Enterococcus alishanensis]MBV7390990.1 amino acid ABC transporter permease [Enterococcus alishanensis]